jgi:hypothetical protein
MCFSEGGICCLLEVDFLATGCVVVFSAVAFRFLVRGGVVLDGQIPSVTRLARDSYLEQVCEVNIIKKGVANRYDCWARIS